MASRPKKSGILLPMRVWDGATRLFHWALVLLIATSYVSISLADGPSANLWMRIHLISGEAMLGLLVFRVIWGLIGSETSRFSRFLRSPAAALRHLSHLRVREPDTEIGHNAAGGWMVLVLLGLIAAQIATGLASNDDGSTEGPLVQFVGKALSDKLSFWHGVIFNVLVAAMALHVVVVIAYAVLKGQNLVRPMITGKKRLPAAARAPRMASPILAVVVLLMSAGIAVFVSLL
jgi:cytochrome b